eukprot:1141089-Rhodomonas_salina.1
MPPHRLECWNETTSPDPTASTGVPTGHLGRMRQMRRVEERGRRGVERRGVRGERERALCGV